MNPDVLKTNMLSIAVAGLLIMLTGIALYLFRDEVSDNVRFFMPIPPPKRNPSVIADIVPVCFFI